MTVSFLRMTVQGGLFVLAAALFRALTLHRLPKRCFVWLWTAALARLLLPFGLPVYTLPQRARTFAVASGESAGAGSRFAIAVWLLAAAGMAGYFVLSHMRFRREMRAAVPVEDERAKRWLRNRKLHRRVELKMLQGLPTPLTYGVARPVIVAPSEIRWGEGSAELALLHELCHIRRFDPALKGLAALALCLHWFNPAVWLLYFLLSGDMELACDEAVLSTLTGDARREYALALLGFEARRDGLVPRAVAFGRNVAEERIRCIMKFKKKSTIAVSIAVAVAAVGTITAFAAGSEAKEKGLPKVALVRTITADSETQVEEVPVTEGKLVKAENSPDTGKYVHVEIKEDGVWEYSYTDEEDPNPNVSFEVVYEAE